MSLDPNILQVDNLSKYFGGLAAVSKCSLKIKKGSITGIIGPNGSGKSTLLDILAGQRVPNGGNLKFGETIKIGYLDQHTNAFKDGKGLKRKVIEFVEESASLINIGKEQLTASQLLERFLFPPIQQHSP